MTIAPGHLLQFSQFATDTTLLAITLLHVGEIDKANTTILVYADVATLEVSVVETGGMECMDVRNE